MADTVGKPPAAGAEDLLRPDAGFHDDKVGAQLKAEEAALRRAAQQKVAQKPRRIIKEPEQVGATSSFRRAQQETPEAATIRRQRALVAGPKAQPKQAPRQAAGQRGDAARVAKRLAALFATLTRLPVSVVERGDSRSAAAGGEELASAKAADHRRVDAIGDAPKRQHSREQATAQAQTVAKESATQASAAVLADAEQEARYQVQLLLAGGTGFVLHPDPQATFAHVFAQLPQWPTRVPPGYVPAKEEDFDAFFAWVFAPGAATVDEMF